MRRPLRWVPLLLLVLAGSALAAEPSAGLPTVTVDFGKTPTGPGLSSTLQMVLLLTVLTLAPAILITTTCFTRIVVVLHFLRQGLGTQSTPSNQVLISLALFLTLSYKAHLVLKPLHGVSRFSNAQCCHAE